MAVAHLPAAARAEAVKAPYVWCLIQPTKLTVCTAARSEDGQKLSASVMVYLFVE
jgi:hypothetical protein